MVKKPYLVISLDRLSKNDELEIGREAAELAEISKFGIPIPKGFVVTPDAFRKFFWEDKKFPEIVAMDIFRAYKDLENSLRNASVIVSASFSKKKFKNVKGEANLTQKIRHFWESYIDGKDIDYPDFEPAILVYKLPYPLRLGVMFTVDPINNDKKVVVIYEGNENGNYYEVSKHDFKVIYKDIKKGDWQKLTDTQISNLAKWGKKLQEHYYFPQEVEFSHDKNIIIVTKTKPITTMGARYLTDDLNKITEKVSSVFLATTPKNPIGARKILVKGKSIYPGIATGHLRIIRESHDVNRLRSGDIAVVTNTKNLDLNVIARKAKAVVIESKFYHLPRHPFPRKYGKPMIVAMQYASKGLREGLVTTVNAANGEVYI